MKPKDPVIALEKASAKVLENWAMMLTDQAEAGDVDFDGELFYGSIEFREAQHTSGQISLVCGAGFGKKLCQNLLGLDETTEVNKTEILDALKEIVNVITDNFVTEAYGASSGFELHSARSGSSSVPDAELHTVGETADFMADDEPVRVSVRLSGRGH